VFGLVLAIVYILVEMHLVFKVPIKNLAITYIPIKMCLTFYVPIKMCLAHNNILNVSFEMHIKIHCVF